MKKTNVVNFPVNSMTILRAVKPEVVVNLVLQPINIKNMSVFTGAHDLPTV